MRTGWGRGVVVTLAIAVTAAGCTRRPSSSGPVAVGTGIATHGASGGGTTTSAGPASVRTGATRSRAQSAGSPGGSAGNTSGGGPSSASPANPVATDATGGPGDLARDLLRPQPAPRDVLEIIAQSGAGPGARAVDHVRGSLASTSGKPVTTPTVPINGGARDWTAAQLRQLADDATAQRQGGGQAVVHLLFLHGTYNGDTSVLGITVRADVIAVFQDQVAGAASPVASAATIEDAVTMHEVGHALGLVDLVLHTGRADPAHPGHSQNKGSVMYWIVDSDLFSQVLNGPPPVNYDSADLADLATIRRGG